ncbi:hypothetical protein DTO164E3_7239 [Paecilomyces variotii]|nr:hypothetical protein DTO164E3_7239 [Paecilomyces variotii]KAJ9198200.1 hypothetical protein DTO032I3_5616 [Paecilomyces variotii]KAJ9222149.1 hypothetical protein DTO169C6_5600 [Paecilomyces variotii]KAJ9274910.1 hypothetical protein DTO021D3_8268 [Paecilomyces variotii]KAJ9344650.1 hypothetical protein DTO027B6_2832 [Paecilomyces variotii]
MAFKTVALFGANGQIGSCILRALLHCSKQSFNVIGFVAPGMASKLPQAPNLKVRELDVTNIKKDELAAALKGVDVVVSALNGKALESQVDIQNAAVDAGVERFYPSEYGFHHIYQKPGDGAGWLHPMWNQKEKSNDAVLHHPAITSGKMSYTLIGCGDFYNQDREPVWCPWTQTNVDSYTFHIIGDPNAKADFTHLDDFADYLVATLLEPEKSENATLNFPSDFISHEEIARLLEKYSGKPVKRDVISLEEMHRVIADPKQAPKELQSGSPFPVDFWFLVKGQQGQGNFFRPRGQTHNHLFPSVRKTTFEKYFQKKFAAR